MTEAVVHARPPAARRTTALVAVLVCAFVFLYRFNALGGALGGFDNDHFLHFAYAKQVQAGAQPLRDFLDGGLQGARPSLTYELSAAAQRVGGDTLLSEALLTTGATAIAAAITALAAWRVAPLPWALVATSLAVLVSSKLYGYPKVLVFAVASWLFLRYAARPSRTIAALLGLWLAVAFLFRHDYAVYVGLGMVVLLGAVHRADLLKGCVRLAGIAVIAAALLTPSLLWIHRHAGLGPYVRNVLAMGQREAKRTDIPWPVPESSPFGAMPGWFVVEENAEFWLYYAFLAVPLLTLVQLWRDRTVPAPVERPALVAIAVMSIVVSAAFLRGNLGARFGDAAVPVAVLAAALMAGAARSTGRARVAQLAVVLLLVAATGAAVWAVGSVGSELRSTGFAEGPSVVARQSTRITRDLAARPAAIWASSDQTSSMQAAQYLHRCTRPSDRVLVMSYAPELFVFADRLFAGGRATTIPEFYDTAAYQTWTLERWRQESVPIVLAEDREIYENDYPAGFPLLDAYLAAEYEEAGALTVDGNHRLRVFARRGVQPAGRFGPDGWPCFGEGRDR